jgi:uncharacterized Zn-finger protein
VLVTKHSTSVAQNLLSPTFPMKSIHLHYDSIVAESYLQGQVKRRQIEHDRQCQSSFFYQPYRKLPGIRELVHRIRNSYYDAHHYLPEISSHQLKQSIVPQQDKVEKKSSLVQSNSARTALENKEFKCNQCQQRFTKQIRLQEHCIVYHGGPRIPCQQCKKTFTRLDNLNQHVKAIHQGQRLQCKYCGQKFTQSGSLNIHIASIHFNKRHACKYCPQTFSQRSNLNRHMETKHPECSNEFENKTL